MHKQRKQAFLLKNKTKLIIIAASAVLLALFIREPLSEAMAPPATAGMSQKEIIQLNN
ncbi:MAG: hypothetical protein JEZ04_07900 [Spirochaetales bacterium]|nr:hypothetical protein [Spirochaetales bacterium]